MVARKQVAVRQAGGGVKVVSQTSGGGFSGGSSAPAASSSPSSGGSGLSFSLNGKQVSYSESQLASLNQAQRATLEAYAKKNPGATPATPASPTSKTLSTTQAQQFKSIYDGFTDPAQKQAWLATAKATLSQQGYDASSVDGILGIKSAAKPA